MLYKYIEIHSKKEGKITLYVDSIYTVLCISVN